MGERRERGWPRQHCNTGVLKYVHIVYYCRKDLGWSIDIFINYSYSPTVQPVSRTRKLYVQCNKGEMGWRIRECM